MSKTYSLQIRLSYGLAFGIAFMWIAAVVISGMVIRHELDEAFDSALQETAQRLLSLAVVDILDHDGALTARRVAPLKPHDEFLTYVVRDKTGNVILHSHDADLRVFPVKPEQGFSNTQSHRIYGEAAVSDSIFIEVAEPLKHRREAAFESTAALVIPLLLIIPLSMAGIWWFIRRSMAPVVGLSRQIDARSAGDLSPLQSTDLPDEVVPISRAVNNLMAQLQRSLDAERSFTANSAHELRTPIAGALAQTQRLISVLSDDELRVRAHEIEASLHRLARISEKLMQLARAEGVGPVTKDPFELKPVLDAIVDEHKRLSGNEDRLRYTPPAAGTYISRIDADTFAILMRNLIENALKHSPAGSPVDILADATEVRVTNLGPALAPDVLENLTQRFFRGPSSSDGSGLGLAIAAAIAANGQIDLEFRSPVRGKPDGFEAIITLA